MKQVKKMPRQQLEKFSAIFMQLGLVLVLFVVFISLEHQTEQEQVLVENLIDSGKTYEIDPRETPIFRKEVVKPQRQTTPRTTPVNLTEIEPVVEDPVIETVISDPDDERIVEVNVNDIVEIDEPDYIDKEDEPTEVSINHVTKIPIFKGCENLSNTESRKCLDKKMSKLVRRHFNTGLASDLGLKSGKHKIRTQFIIDKDGRVTDVKISDVHQKLQKEAKRVIDKIPEFTPGENNGKKVKVRYTLPINFMVE